ncbi:unnamed protein product [Hymenolepis diminuta]|uniref:Expressed conserved protein n=1 Tax=Hymenolepis diminuta TaxID=6216 RepID=A0A0R3SLK5_HYMDI|nr:unnamed protein product [Hymenolepis diminuta]
MKRINPKLLNMVLCVLAVLIFIVAISVDGWGCGGGIFSSSCTQITVHKVTGLLLFTSAWLLGVGLVFIIIFTKYNIRWTGITSCVIIAMASILSFAAIVNYLDKLRVWSPFLSTFGMSVSFTLTVILLLDLVSAH